MLDKVLTLVLFVIEEFGSAQKDNPTVKKIALDVRDAINALYPGE